MLEYLLFQLRKEYQYNTPARSRTSHTHLGPYWLPLQHWYLPSIKNNNIAITRTFPPYPLHPLHTHTQTHSVCCLCLYCFVYWKTHSVNCEHKLLSTVSSPFLPASSSSSSSPHSHSSSVGSYDPVTMSRR